MKAAGTDFMAGHFVKGENQENDSDLDGGQAQKETPAGNPEGQKGNPADKKGKAQEESQDVFSQNGGGGEPGFLGRIPAGI